MKPFDKIQIEVVAKPRMTRSDKWKKRPCVVRYYEFKDKLNLAGLQLPEHYHIFFVIGMPKSWSKKKRFAMKGTKHLQKPDKDNLEKAILDSLFSDDSGVWDGRVTKIWGEHSGIVVYEIDPPNLSLLPDWASCNNCISAMHKII